MRLVANSKLDSSREILFSQTSALFVLISAIPWLWDDRFNFFLMVACSLSAILLFIFPDRIYLLVSTFIAYMGKILWGLPLVANHDIIALILYSVGSLTFVFQGLSKFKIESLRFPTLTALILVYFFGFFHKLNWDFLISDLSCSKWVINSLWAVFKDLSSDPSQDYFPWINGSKVSVLAWMVILLEFSIALFLSLKKTRAIGICLALLFHWALLPLVETFSLLFLSLAVLISSAEASAKTFQLLQSFLNHRRWIFVTFLSFSYLILNFIPDFNMRSSLRGVLTLLWCSPLIAILILNTFKCRLTQDRFPKNIKASFAVGALVLINGISPYVGFKNVTAFSMFSNLNTANNGNHLFLKANNRLFDDQNKLYQIKVSDPAGQPILIADEKFWTAFEIRRSIFHGPLTHEPNIRQLRSFLWVNDRMYFLESEEIRKLPDFSKPIPYWQQKLRLFKEIYSDNRCNW